MSASATPTSSCGSSRVVLRAAVQEATQLTDVVLLELRRDAPLLGLDLGQALQPVLVDGAGVLVQRRPGQDVVAIELVAIGQVADAIAGTDVAGIALEHGQPGSVRRSDVAGHGLHEGVADVRAERSVGQHDGRLLGECLQHAPRLGDAALDDRGSRGPAGRQAGLDVGPVRVHPGGIGRQSSQQASEALRGVGALQPGEVADEPLGTTVLVDGLHLPEAQVMGLAQARDHDAHEVQRDGVLGRLVHVFEGARAPRPSPPPSPAGRRVLPARGRPAGRPSARHPGTSPTAGSARGYCAQARSAKACTRLMATGATDTTVPPWALEGTRPTT